MFDPGELNNLPEYMRAMAVPIIDDMVAATIERVVNDMLANSRAMTRCALVVDSIEEVQGNSAQMREIALRFLDDIEFMLAKSEEWYEGNVNKRDMKRFRREIADDREEIAEAIAKAAE